VIEADGTDKWAIVLEQEMESLERNQTSVLVNLPKGFKAISCRWVFRKKDNEQYKTRLVAKGYSQKEGKLKAQLKKVFDMKFLGEAKKISGMEISRDRSIGKLWLS